MPENKNLTASVAPMMDWTDRHCRWFHRQLSQQVLLYTEMVVADAIIHGPKERLLGFDPAEHPVALQVGGSDPDKLAVAAKTGEQYGYDEININIGCPSDRVQSGRFGACLMEEPDLVATCFAAMQAAVDIPVTVKCRLGVDDQDLDETLPRFIETVAEAGCTHFIIHARKAWLKGLSPKENRTVPPIDYDRVNGVKARFPKLQIVVNGQIETISQGLDLCEQGALDGFMLGRAAYHTPWILTDIDAQVYGRDAFGQSREDIALALIDYAKITQDVDRTTKALIRHAMGLFSGEVGARLWRRQLSEGLSAKLLPSDVLQQALDAMSAMRDAA
ncbi:tRNA dihydrouridine(20/20a) synthase DusA [Litorimonas sp. RW-G-Af-16]|uniref:tRNA dihydrouridine(20/20a) synthase DusA n=1 Tax=Litorimonas sp. RW-G-Af-16 TaxID=3241168 RepID=UPI00390C47BC